MTGTAVNRPLVIAAIGVLIVVGALILNYSVKTPGGLLGGFDSIILTHQDPPD